MQNKYRTAGTKIRTMLITVSTRSLVLSSLIIVMSVNTSSTFQYDWWNNLTSDSSQEAMKNADNGLWLPDSKHSLKDKFWSTAWTPMISVTVQQSNLSTTTPAPNTLKNSTTTSTAAGVSSSSSSSAATAALLHTMRTLSHSVSPATTTTAQQQHVQTSSSPTTTRSENDSLEWQPSISNHHEHHRSGELRDEFNAFAARNTRTYLPVGKNKANQATSQKVRWDDHIEFPGSSGRTSQKIVTQVDIKSTTASIWADQDQTSPLSDSLPSSTNSKKWSSRTGSQRISSRKGIVRQKQLEITTTSSPILEDIRQDVNLEKSYEDAISDIQSQSEAAGVSSAEDEENDAPVNERLRTNGKTRNISNDRLAVKGRQQQVKTGTARQASKVPPAKDRQTVSLRIKISPVEPTKSQRWSDAKVSQYFRWEDPNKSSDRLVEDSDEDQQEIKNSDFAKTTAQVWSQASISSTTSRPKVSRIGSIKSTTSVFSRQRQPIVTTTTTTFPPDYESEEEEFLTEKPVTTTQQPQLESVYQKTSRQAVKQTANRQQQQKQQQPAVKTSNKLSAKSQSVVHSNGNGYEWSSDIDHSDERPAEIKTTSSPRLSTTPAVTSSARFRNPTTKTVLTTTTKGTSSTARPSNAANLQTKSRQTSSTSQRISAISVAKKYSYDEVSSVASVDPDDDLEEESDKFQKKSGVQYSPISVEREEDVSVDKNFNKKSGDRSANEEEDPENCRLEDSIPGIPLTDYPTYAEIPVTSFKCSDHTLPGYYGDVEAQCQVFHVCQADGRKNDFLCPVGTIFNQEIFVCDWWQNFRCQDTPNFYVNNDLLYRTPPRRQDSELRNNLLRKRTDTIEREDEPPFSDEVGSDSDDTNEDSLSGSSLTEEEETEASPPVSSTTVRPAQVKGYREKQKVSGKTSGRVTKSASREDHITAYGARVSQQKESDGLAAASSKSVTTLAPSNNNGINVNNRNQTSTTVKVSEVTQRMSTSSLPLPVN